MKTTVRSHDSGFALAMTMVFLLVLSVTMLFASSLTWTDMRVVTTIRDEKMAVAIAEAGINEALKRLSLTQPTLVNPNGTSIDAAFSVPASPLLCDDANAFCPDETNPNWSAVIRSGSGTTSKSGNQVTTYTIQDNSASPLAYTKSLTNTPPNPDAGELTMRWNCSSPANGWPCNGTGGIRKLFNFPVLDVIATGEYPSGHPMAASRKVTVSLIPGIPGLGTYGDGCTLPSGVDMQGTVQVNVTGSIQVNSTCTGSPYAINGTGGTLVQTGGQMNVVGNVDTGHAQSPDLNQGAPRLPDPLGPSRANLLQPCFGSLTPGTAPGGCYDLGANTPTVQNHSTNPDLPDDCTGTATNPVTCNLNQGSTNSVTLKPGIYYGGINARRAVTFDDGLNGAPGIYILAGGGLDVDNGSTTLIGSNIMIFNTQNDDSAHRAAPGDIQTFDTQGTPTVQFSAVTSGYYQGIVFFQARFSDGITTNPQPEVNLQGGNGTDSVIDGLFYAVDANAHFYGGVNVAGNLLVRSMTSHGSVNITGTATTSPLIAGKAGFTQIVAWTDY